MWLIKISSYGAGVCVCVCEQEHAIIITSSHFEEQLKIIHLNLLMFELGTFEHRHTITGEREKKPHASVCSVSQNLFPSVCVSVCLIMKCMCWFALSQICNIYACDALPWWPVCSACDSNQKMKKSTALMQEKSTVHL